MSRVGLAPKQTILVVDDNPGIREGLRVALRPRYRVLTASSTRRPPTRAQLPCPGTQLAIYLRRSHPRRPRREVPRGVVPSRMESHPR